MIKEDYVSFEVAKLLKEKGFDGDCGDCECHMFYHEMTDRIMPIMEIGMIPDYDTVYFAPTHQMAMAWLRKIHNIFIVIEPYTYNYVDEKISSYVISLWQEDNCCENITSKNYPTYEETVEAAIKYCLENLL